MCHPSLTSNSTDVHLQLPAEVTNSGLALLGIKLCFSDGCPLQVEDGHFLGGQCYSGNVLLLMCLGKDIL